MRLERLFSNTSVMETLITVGRGAQGHWQSAAGDGGLTIMEMDGGEEASQNGRSGGSGDDDDDDADDEADDDAGRVLMPAAARWRCHNRQ